MLVPLLSLQALAAGPHPVGWSDRAFDDAIAGQVAVRVYYPSADGGPDAEGDAAGGPYPLAVFLHGWLGAAWMYDAVCEELASWGYVVVSLDTETGLVLDMERFADDAVAALHWVEARGAVADDPLAGLVADEGWTAVGHSMGGATLGRLVGREPRIRAAVQLLPYVGEPLDYEGMAAFDGSLLVVSGSDDTTAPPAMQHDWFERADGVARSLLVEVEGMGHRAPTDLASDGALPTDLQRAIAGALAATFVRAEQGGDEALWAELVAPVAEVPVALRSSSPAPVLWAEADGRAISLGVAGPEGGTAEVLFAGAVDADGRLVDPLPAGRLDLPSGLAEATIEAPAELAGPVWLAVRTESEAHGAAFTRAIALTLPEGAGDPATSTLATAPGPSASGGVAAAGSAGCSTAPRATFLAPALLGLCRRRRRA